MQRLWTPALLGTLGGLWTGIAFAQDRPLLLAATAALGVLLILLHRPSWGLWVLVLVHPITYAYTGTVSRTGDFLLPLLILGSWGLHCLWNRRDVALPPGFLAPWFAVFVGWMVFTSLFGVDPPPGFMAAFRYALLALILLAVFNLWTQDQLGRALFLYSLVLIPIAVFGVWQAVTWGSALARFDPMAPNRAFSIYNNPNTLGYVMSHGLVILIAYTLVFWTRTRITLERGVILTLLLMAALLLALGLIVSISRSSFLYAACAVALLTFTRKEFRVPALGAILGMASFLILFFPGLILYALRPGSGFSYRDSLWRAGWRMLQDNPWTGVGMGLSSFEDLRAAYMTTIAHRGLLTTPSGQAHNVFLTKGAEMGWLGLFLALALFVLLLTRIPKAIRAYQNGDWLKGAAAAGILGLTARGFFESGATLGTGHVTHSLVFFLFALVLLWEPTPSLPAAEPAS